VVQRDYRNSFNPTEKGDRPAISQRACCLLQPQQEKLILSSKGRQTMYRSVIVPLDGSSFGEHALPLAASIARRSNASLQLVHVVTPLSAVYAETLLAPDPEIEAEYVAQHCKYLERMAGRVKEFTGVTASCVVLSGEVALTLRMHMAKESPDLIVMTTHGRGALGRFWLGSMADDLVRHLHTPLLLVRPGGKAPEWSPLPAPRHLIVTLDGTPVAEQILEPALALAGLMEAELTLLRVIKPVIPMSMVPEGVTLDESTLRLQERIEAVQREQSHKARTYLEQVAERLRHNNRAVQTRVMTEDNTSRAILHAGATGATDLIALATHGRRGLQRLLLGSVADKVIRGATVPVLVLRPKQE
jgi:nucleotide-binding universal stress UspA family protein